MLCWLVPCLGCSALFATLSSLFRVWLIKHLGATSSSVNLFPAEECLSLDSICSNFPIFLCSRGFQQTLAGFLILQASFSKPAFVAQRDCFPGHSWYLGDVTVFPYSNKCFLILFTPPVYLFFFLNLFG